MLSSITVILLQLKSYNQSVCVSNLLVNNNIFNYCQKTKSLNSAKLDSAVYLSQNHGHMFLNTEIIQASTISARVSNINVNSFALFGLNLNAQNITGSTISVNLDFQVITGALVCIACDLFVHNSVLKFEARGKQVSAVLLETQDNVELKLTTIQYRLDSQQASGIAGVVRSKPSLFSVEGCKMSGFDFALSGNSGFIASDVQVRISLKLDAFFVCVNSPNALGQLSVAIDQTGAAQADCSICGVDSVVYGLCGPKIPNSQLEGGQFVCSSPFELINGQCECQKGFVLNGSACVKIIDELQLLKSNSMDADLSAVKAGLDKAVQDQAKVNADLDASIQSSATALEKAISDNGQLIASILNGNVSALNKRLEDNATIINGQMLQAITLLQDQINELKKKKPCDSAINISTNDTYQIADRVVVCSLPIYVNRFDIAAVTNTVSSITGFSSTVLQDAFIDVQSVYSSSVSPLFTVQKSFTNIKIQIAGQAVKSGSILSNSDTITIVEMKIISKSGDMTGTGSQLNILAASSSNSAISHLLINVSFKSTSSNVALIGSVSGTLTIANYQVLGTYETTSGQMGLVTLLCNDGDVTIENVNLNPSSIAFGNQSSYLFCVVNGSQVELKGILLVLGNASQKQVLFSVYTQYMQNHFEFGGVLYLINSSQLIIQQLVHNSNQSCSSKYVQFSGFAIGYGNGSNNSVYIQQLCFQAYIDGTYPTQFANFGLIGNFEGILVIKSSNIYFSASGSNFTFNGLIGSTTTLNTIMELNGIIISVNLSSDNSIWTNALGAWICTPNITVTNIKVQHSVIHAKQGASGLFGYTNQGTIVIKHFIVQLSNFSSITGQGQVSAVFGATRLQIQISNSKIFQVRLDASQNCGLVVGLVTTDTKFESITDFSSEGLNYIVDSLVQNCANLSNPKVQRGC
ncbi:Hypothetical_protein [Hexamita inflata]|uniref:Hypothetical_protein n=2 Tax=Hexamita inflata TaxID=28002 RepID=A0AA86R3H4_9EUKA|nr:Hypothetical protein HINF_LOCUS56277 [Hexamita inflata]